MCMRSERTTARRSFCCFQLGYKLLKIHHHNWNTCANMQENYVKSMHTHRILHIQQRTAWQKNREREESHVTNAQ